MTSIFQEITFKAIFVQQSIEQNNLRTKFHHSKKKNHGKLKQNKFRLNFDFFFGLRKKERFSENIAK